MTNIVRTPTKATGGITDAERDAMKKHADLWISRAMRTTPVDVDEITSAVHDLYAAAGLKQPRVVVVPSPLVMAFAYGASAAIWWNRKTDNAVGNAVRDAAYNAVYNAVVNATRNAVYNATRTAVDNATRTAVDNATRTAVDNAADNAVDNATQACLDLAGNFGLNCAVRWSSVYQGGAYWAAYDCYLTAMRDIIGLRLPEYEKYAAWERCSIAAPFRVLHEEFCIVSDFPEVLRIDDQNLPHCENGPSHRWRDGWSLYHWHGVSIPAEWIEDRASLTPQIALTWQNIEQRRAACEILGWESILSELKARVINENDDPQVGTLVEVTLPDAGKERFLRVVCGTGRKFALPVPKEMKTAIQAQAWTYGFDHVADYQSPEVRT
jgi:hypothetical protein